MEIKIETNPRLREINKRSEKYEQAIIKYQPEIPENHKISNKKEEAIRVIYGLCFGALAGTPYRTDGFHADPDKAEIVQKNSCIGESTICALASWAAAREISTLSYNDESRSQY